MIYVYAAIVAILCTITPVKASQDPQDPHDASSRNRMFIEKVSELADLRAKNEVYCLNLAGHNISTTQNFTFRDEKIKSFQTLFSDKQKFDEYIKVADIIAFIENLIHAYTTHFRPDLSEVSLDQLGKDASPDDLLDAAHILLYKSSHSAHKVAQTLHSSGGFDVTDEFIATANAIEDLILTAHTDRIESRTELMNDLIVTRCKLILHLLKKEAPKSLSPMTSLLVFTQKFKSTKIEAKERFSSSLSTTFNLEDFADCVVQYLVPAFNRSNILSGLLGAPSDQKISTLHLAGLQLTKRGPFTRDAIIMMLEGKQDKDFYKDPAKYIQDMIFNLFIEEYICAYYSSIRSTFDPEAPCSKLVIEPASTQLEQAFREAMMMEFSSLMAQSNLRLSLTPLAYITPALVNEPEEKYRVLRDKIIAHYFSHKVGQGGTEVEIEVTSTKKSKHPTPVRDRLRRKLQDLERKPTAKSLKTAAVPAKNQEQEAALKNLLEESEELQRLKKTNKSVNAKLERKTKEVADLKTRLKELEEKQSTLLAQLKNQAQSDQTIAELEASNKDLSIQLSATAVERNYQRENATKAQEDLNSAAKQLSKVVAENQNLEKQVFGLNQQIEEHLQEITDLKIKSSEMHEAVQLENQRLAEELDDHIRSTKRKAAEYAEAHKKELRSREGVVASNEMLNQEVKELRHQLEQTQKNEEKPAEQLTTSAMETIADLSKAVYAMQIKQAQDQAELQRLNQAVAESTQRAEAAEADLHAVNTDPYLLQGTFAIGGRQLTLSELAQYAQFAVVLENQGVDLAASIKQAAEK